MKVVLVIYSAFSDTVDIRNYYDLIIAHEGIAIVNVGSLPIVYKHRSPLPRTVEMFLLRISKESSRRNYANISELVRRGKAKFIPQESIVGCTLREREIPIPPILRKPPGDPREKIKYTERVLELNLFVESPSGVEAMRFYTTPKLKDRVKRALKEVGVYLALPNLR